MMDVMETATSNERRRFHRVQIPEGYVHCTTEGQVSYYALSDLSAGGARLRGLRPLSPGSDVEVILFLPQWDTASFDGTVRRVSRQGTRFHVGLEFAMVPPALQNRLIELIRREIRLSGGPVAVWACPDVNREPGLRTALRRLGYSLVCESSPLGVVTRLDDPTLPVELVFLEGQLGTLPLTELLRYLRRSHPKLPLYVVGDFDEDTWEEIYALVEGILDPGVDYPALKPMLP
jgi:hypothetical protein